MLFGILTNWYLGYLFGGTGAFTRDRAARPLHPVNMESDDGDRRKCRDAVETSDGLDGDRWARPGCLPRGTGGATRRARRGGGPEEPVRGAGQARGPSAGGVGARGERDAGALRHLPRALLGEHGNDQFRRPGESRL